MTAPALCIDAVFTVHGVDAILDADGAAHAVRLLPSQGDDEMRFGGLEILDATGVFEIRASDFGAYGDGAVLEIAGARRVVQSHRTKDIRRLKVILNTVEAS